MAMTISVGGLSRGNLGHGHRLIVLLLLRSKKIPEDHDHMCSKSSGR